MKNFIRKNAKLLIILGVPFCLFLPSIFTFYTNDDFFLLKIAKAENISGFLNFFSLTNGPDGLGMYRPLTIQVFYMLAWKFFNLNPLGLHIVSYIFFFLVIGAVYSLGYRLFKNRYVAFLAALLYGISATHFAHLYYLATFQELGVTLFVLLSVLAFIDFLSGSKKKNLLLSIIWYLLALMSKETAVITPVLLSLVWWFFKFHKQTKLNLKRVAVALLPFLIVLGVYMFFRIYYYGFATGDSYIWDFSIRKFINTIAWYVVWSFNLPETLVDFVGPGLKLNPNLFIYWSKQMIPIFILFGLEMVFVIYVMLKSILVRDRRFVSENNFNSLFCAAWFLVSLLPVVFLPLHKFTFYLTLPLIGVVFRISQLISKVKINIFLTSAFVFCWLVLSVMTINYSVNTSWITRGQIISKKTYNFINEKYGVIDRDIVFADTTADSDLPWSPTQVVKTALSDQNFFKVYFPEFSFRVYYGASAETNHQNSYIILSRTLLGY